MKPESIGRVVGAGLRIAGRMAGQRILGEGQSATGTGAPPQAARPAMPDAAARGRVAGQATRGVAKGVGGFLRPFQRVGGKIWLEVTGVFFLLMSFVFAWYIARSWGKLVSGMDRTHLVVEVGTSLMFLYLGVSSFWRAQKK